MYLVQQAEGAWGTKKYGIAICIGIIGIHGWVANCVVVVGGGGGGLTSTLTQLLCLCCPCGWRSATVVVVVNVGLASVSSK